MPSEYDALLGQPTSQSSDYDALLEHPSAKQSGVGQILKTAGEAALQVGKEFVTGLPRMAVETLFPEKTGLEEITQAGKLVSKVASGQPIVTAEEQVYGKNPLVEAEKTPAFSKERFEVGFSTLAQIAGLAAGVRGFEPTLRETAFGKPPPETLSEAVANEPIKGGEVSATQERQVEKGVQPERARDDARGTSSETSVSSGVRPEAKVQSQEGEVAPVPEEKKVGVGAVSGTESPPASATSMGGIKQDVAERRSAIEPGEGWTPQSAIEWGRSEIQKGHDPEPYFAKAEQGQPLSGEEMAVARARIEQFEQATDKAKDALAKDPSNPVLQASAQEADTAEATARQRLKPAQTEWGRAGAAQQFETEVNTGSIHGLRRLAQRVLQRDVTPEETPKIEQQAVKVKTAVEGEKQARKSWADNVNKFTKDRPLRTREELFNHFAERMKLLNKVC